MTTRIDVAPVRAGTAALPPAKGHRIDVSDLSRSVRGGLTVLSSISFSIDPGDLVAVVGGSGAGKTTLLEAVAGVRRPRSDDRGVVTYDGAVLHHNLEAVRASTGYVPQDDIVHKDLPLRATLRYAGELRLSGSVSGQQLDERVEQTLAALDLAHRADVQVGALSGGQRRRASVGVELLTQPRVFFLDEPTSGLDPSSQAEIMRLLRRLADSGSTVVLTTHAPDNVDSCDKMLFLTHGGRLAFFGTPAQAREYFEVDDIAKVYERLSDEATPAEWAERFDASDRASRPAADDTAIKLPVPRRVTSLRQWATLTRRSFEILVRNRLTLAILLGSPVMVVLMLAVLFRAGAFDLADPHPAVAVMIVYWVAFGGFFFGVTYGLLQIVSEFPIFRRERLVNLGIGAYVLSKLTVLVPFLALVDVATLGVLRLFGRLPVRSWETYASLGTTLFLDAVAALAIGLLASALVSEPAQASLALPLICWPQVLFSGALVPVPVMATAGRWMSLPITDRWAFEGMCHTIGLNHLFAQGHSPLGPPLLTQFGSTFSHSVWGDWVILAVSAAAGLLATCLVLAARTRTGTRSA